MNFEELRKKVLAWARDKDLIYYKNSDKQFMKFVEESYELKTEMNLYSPGDDSYYLIDEMGDVFVTLIILCEQLKINPIICLLQAYRKISKRKGITRDGTFIKEEDL